jgi:hypothetical protein
MAAYSRYTHEQSSAIQGQATQAWPFPYADREALAEAFDRVETEEIGEGTHEKYHQWVHELVGAGCG